MKGNRSIFVIASLILLAGGLSAEESRSTLLTQDFSSTTFPPTGWTISANSANWSRVTTSNAGGTSGEAMLNWSPQFTTGTYLISPSCNTSGITTIYLELNHFLDYYTTPFTIGAATRSNTSDTWSNVWTLSPTANVGPQLKSITITNADVGSSTFQFALFFSGDSYNVDAWFIDNIILSTPHAYDLAITSYTMPTQPTGGVAFNPICTVKNLGATTLTAKASLNIYHGATLVASHPDNFIGSLALGAQQIVTFPSFTPLANEAGYRYVFSVTSQESVTDNNLTNNSKEGYFNTWSSTRQKVLLEIGTGTWCQYCPGAAMGADDLVTNGQSVAVVENHNNTGGADIFSTTDSNGRNSYYSISGYPTSMFDGTLQFVGGSNTSSMYSNFLPLYNQRAAIKAPADLFIHGTNSGNNYSITIRVQKTANLLNSNLVLQVALTESNITYSWQGQTHLNYVSRLMVPNYSGTAITLAGMSNGNYYYNLSFTKNAAWVAANCELVAFIQDLTTKEVLQAQKIALNSLQPLVYPITAAFTADVTTGLQPLTVHFTDQTVPQNGSLTTWLWQFGDGQTSSLQNPFYTYNTPGTYNVSLTVTDVASATNTATRNGYITVEAISRRIRLISAGALDFGSVYVEEESPYSYVVFRNSGNVDVTVGSIHFAAAPLHFEFMYPARDIVLTPGETDSIMVRFTPGAIGPISDTIYLDNNSTNLPQLMVTLNGTGLLVLPNEPENLTVERHINDAILSWEPVTLNQHGQIIVPDGYAIYYAEEPYGDYQYLDTSSTPNYTHSNAFPGSMNRFYQIRTVKNY
jgi:PKD repeat protein